jgi:membrane dipeptidase
MRAGSEGQWVVDFHCDTLSQAMRDKGGLAVRPAGHLDLQRLAASGVHLQVFACFSNPSLDYACLRNAALMVEIFWQTVDAGQLRPVLWQEDITSMPPGGPVMGLLSLEGAEPIGSDLRMLQHFYRLGVRAVGLTWNGRNALADGVGEAESRGGLTSAGRRVIAEMNRLRMLIDVSHLSEAGFWDVAGVCRGPFIASHSNARVVCDHKRNLRDDQLRAIAASGGVVGINFYPPFLTSGDRATSSDILRHAGHMLSVMGRGRVGLGSDFDGISSTPGDVSTVSDLPYLATVLAREFGEEVAAEIMGGSFAALLAQALPARTASLTGTHYALEP